MLFNSYSYEILYEQFHWICLQDIKFLLVTVNHRLKFEIKIVHDLSCHPIFAIRCLFRDRPKMKRRGRQFSKFWEVWTAVTLSEYWGFFFDEPELEWAVEQLISSSSMCLSEVSRYLTLPYEALKLWPYDAVEMCVIFFDYHVKFVEMFK